MKRLGMKRCKWKAVWITALLCVLFVAVVLLMFMKIKLESRQIMEDSIKAQMLSAAVAAREIIDTDAMVRYSEMADINADRETYDNILQRLHNLAQHIGAKYIYALKRIDGHAYFVFDTDSEDLAVLEDYGPYDEDLEPVHHAAFAGHDAVEIYNYEEGWGNFHTGAVPVQVHGQVIGIVVVDIENTYLDQYTDSAQMNLLLLVLLLAVMIALVLWVVIVLTRRTNEMQDKLERLAHYDNVTQLPNRQYLLDYLAAVTAKDNRTPFAMLFIDLDNFKAVNDNAGHDAGDALLRSIADYLRTAPAEAKSFRPSAGMLNVAARVGGDEFIQLVPHIATEEEAAQYAEKLLAGFGGEEISRYVERYKVGMSIGIALYPYHSDNYHVLIKYADIAMYHAKNAGKNSFRIYQDEMEPKEEK